MPIIFILIGQQLICQEYSPFNFAEGIWICNYHLHNEQPIGIESLNYQYYTEGDTIINSTEYFKFYRYGFVSWSIPQTDTINDYIGAIRNNDAKQVIWVNHGDTVQKIIYDFNLGIGDTIKRGYGNEDNLIVRTIDSIEFCGKYFKRFNLNDSVMINQALIESIGFNSGLIDPFFNQHENTSALECYIEVNNANCLHCDLLLSTHSIVDIDLGVTLVPNPCTDYIEVISPVELKFIWIFDSNGRILQKFTQINDTRIRFSTKEYTSGVYIMLIENKNNRRISQKIIRN